MFVLEFTQTAEAQLRQLAADNSLTKRRKAVRKALDFLAANPRHPSLNTHEWHSQKCPHGGKMFEAYAENNTAGAYRIFWCYSPTPSRITVIAITPHP